jgi:uncharacterized phage protein (TIGR01671 family)
MGRKHKYRLWDVESESYVDKDAGYFIELDGSVWFNAGEGWSGDQLTDRSNELIIEQFTGLLDRNGKEIFEGDIVKFENEAKRIVGVVIFERGTFMLDIPALKDKDFNKMIFACRMDTETNWSVVGNIHETPAIHTSGNI